MIARVSIALLCLTGVLALSASAEARPTFKDAREAAHYFLDDYADLLDGKVRIAGCANRGERSVVCSIRIVGPAQQRFRLVVTAQRTGSLLAVRARPLR